MEDIVKRLELNSGWRDDRHKCTTDPALLKEAASEIERLREALKWYASADAWTMEQTEGSNGDYGTKARAALNPKE